MCVLCQVSIKSLSTQPVLCMRCNEHVAVVGIRDTECIDTDGDTRNLKVCTECVIGTNGYSPEIEQVLGKEAINIKCSLCHERTRDGLTAGTEKHPVCDACHESIHCTNTGERREVCTVCEKNLAVFSNHTTDYKESKCIECVALNGYGRNGTYADIINIFEELYTTSGKTSYRFLYDFDDDENVTRTRVPFKHSIKKKKKVRRGADVSE